MQSTAFFLITVIIYAAFGIAAAVWMARRKKAGKAVALWVRIILIFIFLSSGINIFTYFVSPIPKPTAPSAKIFYIKSGGANVRGCPSISCEILETLPPNAKLNFPESLFDKYPDWVEITFPDGELGYISKSTLSEKPVSTNEQTQTGGTSSTGNITVGPWADIQAVVGESYEFHFCEPSSAISGATCGGLSGTTTNPKGGKPPYSFIKQSGFLPPGMALELNGTFSGAPTQAGTYNFRLCAKDLYGGEGCQNLTVFVNKSATPAAVQAPPVEDASFAKIESATCQALGRSVPGNPNSWIVYRVTVTGTGGASVGGGIDFFCDSRYGGGPCHNQSSSCDSWTEHPEYQSCRREAGQPATTGWTYQAEGFINTEIGFNFGVQAGHADKVATNVSCN